MNSGGVGVVEGVRKESVKHQQAGCAAVQSLGVQS